MRKAFQLRRSGIESQDQIPSRPAHLPPDLASSQASATESLYGDSCPTPPPIRDGRLAPPPSPPAFEQHTPSAPPKRASVGLFSRVKTPKKAQIPYVDPSSAAAASLYFDSASVNGDRPQSRAVDGIPTSTTRAASSSVTVASPAKSRRPRPSTPDFSTTRPGSGASLGSDSSNPLYQHVDSKQILSWMESSRGCMRGDVSFRTKLDSTAMSEWMSAYCYIKSDDGSLRHEQPAPSPAAPDDTPVFRTLADHLHGCQVSVVSSSDGWPAIHVRLRQQQEPASGSASSAASPRKVSLREQNARLREAGAFKSAPLDVTQLFYHDLEIRPADDAQMTAWLAALLCWRPVRPGRSTLDNTEITTFQTYLAHSAFESASDEEHVVIKSGEAKLYDTATLGLMCSPMDSKPEVAPAACLLRANGEFSFRRLDAQLPTLVQITLLPRSAIRRLDPTLSGSGNALIVFPSYSSSKEASPRLRPFALSFPTKSLLESWLLLLKTFASPEILRPNFSRVEDDFDLSEDLGTLEPGVYEYQLQQSIELQVKSISFSDFTDTLEKQSSHIRSGGRPHQHPSVEFDIGLMADGHPIARTSAKASLGTGDVSRHDRLAIFDMPQNALRFSIRIIRRDRLQEQNDYTRPDTATTNASRNEPDFAEAFICYNAVPAVSEETETRQLLNRAGMYVGEVTFKCSYLQEPLLAEAQYDEVTKLLRSLKNSLTLKLYARFPTSSAAYYSGLLLNVFQSVGGVVSWLQDLITKDIILSSDPKRVIAEPAKSEQTPYSSSSNNTLFRDNTLLTRVLDEHMKRIGRDYLEETIGSKLRAVRDDDFHCEIDPNLASAEQAAHSWDYLIFTVRRLWKAIAGSAQRCPRELRDILRHARDTAIQAFGPESPQVFSSVTAFLFLRFFVPAIMAPHLWDLISEQPNERVSTTLKHLSRTLNTLANLTEFGAKQPWMLPMNDFILPQRQSMKDFINDICDVPRDSPPSRTGPTETRASAAGPAQDATARLRERLPAPLREGLPLLPGLVTPGATVRELAEWWVGHVEQSSGLENAALDVSSDAFDPALSRFTRACRELRAKAADVLRLTPRARREACVWASDWLAIAEAVEERPESVWRVPAARAPAAGSVTPRARRGSARASVLSGASSNSSERNRMSKMQSGESRAGEDRRREKARDAGKARTREADRTPRKTASPPRVDPYENMKRKMGWDM